ncbi:hypothetical protein F4604DRAFT_1694258 [Suillus subluteus]|nr:hypothetical protein F4604DRAFT_1694258 [Suillus subluteus]
MGIIGPKAGRHLRAFFTGMHFCLAMKQLSKCAAEVQFGPVLGPLDVNPEPDHQSGSGKEGERWTGPLRTCSQGFSSSQNTFKPLNRKEPPGRKESVAVIMEKFSCMGNMQNLGVDRTNYTRSKAPLRDRIGDEFEMPEERNSVVYGAQAGLVVECVFWCVRWSLLSFFWAVRTKIRFYMTFTDVERGKECMIKAAFSVFENWMKVSRLLGKWSPPAPCLGDPDKFYCNPRDKKYKTRQHKATKMQDSRIIAGWVLVK